MACSRVLLAALRLSTSAESCFADYAKAFRKIAQNLSDPGLAIGSLACRTTHTLKGVHLLDGIDTGSYVLVLQAMWIYYLWSLASHRKMVPHKIFNPYLVVFLVISWAWTFDVYYRKGRADLIIAQFGSTWDVSKSAWIGGFLFVETMILPIVTTLIVKVV
jgi:hypothetical protein